MTRHAPHEAEYWLRLTERQAYALAAGQLPAEVQAMAHQVSEQGLQALLQRNAAKPIPRGVKKITRR